MLKETISELLNSHYMQNRVACHFPNAHVHCVHAKIQCTIKISLLLRMQVVPSQSWSEFRTVVFVCHANNDSVSGWLMVVFISALLR